MRVVVALGSFGWDGALRVARRGAGSPRRARGRSSATAPRSALGDVTLLGCYHPSQHNTFTGRLTREMLDDVFGRARALTGSAP